MRRAAFVREGLDGGPRPDARGEPALEIVALGGDFAVRAVNYSNEEQWLALADVEPGRGVDKLVTLTSLVQFSSAEMRDCEPHSSSADRVRRPMLLHLRPGATIDLGRGLAYVADGVDVSWPRVVFAERWCLDSPGGYGRVLAQWAAPTPITPPVPAAGIPAESFHVASAEGEPSNFADIYPEYTRTDVDPNAPPKQRLPMPEHLRETARELGLE